LKAVLDTNIFVSALIGRAGPSAQILDHWVEGRFDLYISDTILSEIEEARRRPAIVRRFRRSEEWIIQFLATLREAAPVVEPVPVEAIPEDPPDNLILGTAIAARADYLVSGNDHLLALGRFEGVPIVTPRRFLEILEAGEPGA
jgi:putative PIN family toxin of toxin-antitoxin system